VLLDILHTISMTIVKGIIEGITIEVNLDEMLKMTQQET
jgi:hypothetical protein